MMAERKIELFEYQLYGNYKCCVCGEPLFWCICIGEESDINGYEWRSFCPTHYDELKASGMTDAEIYDKYQVSELV